MKQYLSLKKQQLQDSLSRRTRSGLFRSKNSRIKSSEVEGSEFSECVPGEKLTDLTLRTTSNNVRPLKVSDAVGRKLKEFKKLIVESKSYVRYMKKFDDRYMLRFLRSTNMNSNEALGVWKSYWKLYTNLKAFYALQAANAIATSSNETISPKSSIYSNTSVRTKAEELVPFESPKVADCLSSGWVQCPPARDLDGRQLLLVYPRMFDPIKYTSSDVCAAAFNILNILLCSETTQEHGFCLIIDCSKSPPENLNFNNFKKTVFVLQKCLPAFIGRIIIISFPSYVKALWRSTQSLFSKELRKRVSLIHAKTAEQLGFELEQFFDESNLPYEYDGTLEWDIENGMKEWVVSKML